MSDDRVTETPRTTVIERRGGGGILIAVVLLIAVAVGAFYLYNRSRNENLKTDAITGAARDVGDSAKKVGDAADSATKQ